MSLNLIKVLGLEFRVECDDCPELMGTNSCSVFILGFGLLNCKYYSIRSGIKGKNQVVDKTIF